MQQSVNMQTLFKELKEFEQSSGENRLTNLQLPGCVPPGQAQLVQGTKEWHLSVTPNRRGFNAHKFFQSILPIHLLQPHVLLDRRVHRVVAYARKVEAYMYEVANSSSEYYHLLARKTYEVQKELHKNRQEKREEQLQILQQQVQQQQQQQQQPSQPADTSSYEKIERVMMYRKRCCKKKANDGKLQQWRRIAAMYSRPIEPVAARPPVQIGQ